MGQIRPIREPWKGTLNARERFIRQMHYKSVDRCFNMEFGYWKENYEQWKIFTENGVTNEQDANTLFAFDQISTLYGNLWACPAFENKVVGRKDDRIIRQNVDGLIEEIRVDGKTTIPRIIGSSVTTPEDWKRVKEEHFVRNTDSRIVDIVKTKSSVPDDRDYPIGVYCGSMIGKVRDLLSFEGLCYACYDYPDMVEDMVETSCQLVEDFLDQVLPIAKFDFAAGWEDICYNHGPIVSVAFFRDVVMPRYKRIRKKLDKYGVDIWYTDCDGDVRPILPYLIEGGINCLFPYEVNSCAHPGVLLDKYDGQLRIMGGVDKMALGKGPAAIKAYLESLDKYVKRGGFIPFCDHRCPPNVKEEDYLYYLDLKERMFGV